MQPWQRFLFGVLTLSVFTLAGVVLLVLNKPPAVSSPAPHTDDLLPLIPGWLPTQYHRGDLLVFLFSPGCHACSNVAATVGEYLAHDELPPVVGLTAAPKHDIDDFRARFALTFDVFSVDRVKFLRIIGIAGVPQLIYVTNGQPQLVWFRSFPAANELREALELSDVGHDPTPLEPQFPSRTGPDARSKSPAINNTRAAMVSVCPRFPGGQQLEKKIR